MAKKSKKQNIDKIVTTKDIKENIVTTDYSEEMKKSYIDYAMSVIAGRAFADVRDGFKPVQRRILYAMDELNLGPNTAHKKCARIVGDTMGKYHPHGDSSIYGGLVTMGKDWTYPYPLVDGHGNFGSIEGDGAAAMRYTEARLAAISKKYFFDDIDKDTIDFMPNFDETEKEPVLLPAKIPNLLISGTEGIGCGMAASIPSHNAAEVIDGVLAYIKNPKITIEGLMEYIKGPDFATGGVISNKKDLLEIYKTGNGKIKVRGRVEIEDAEAGRQRIVITEIPYTMIGAIDKFMESVADLVRSKKAPDIVDIINMSSKEGIRIVIELKKGADVQKNLNILYKKTKLEDTFGTNLLAVKDSQPNVYDLKSLIVEFMEFQNEIYTRKYEYLLKKEKTTKEIKEGLIKACDCIDLIIEILRGSKTKQMAKDCLVTGNTDGINFKTQKSKKDASKLLFTELQANAIMSMQLQSLIGLEIDQLKADYEKCNKNIAEYEGYLGSKTKMKNKIASELKKIREDLSKPRKTDIIDAEEIILEKEEIEEQDYVALIDRFGYIKLIDIPTYQRNIDTIPSSYKHIINTKNTDKVFIFTNNGKRHYIKSIELPLLKYKEKGVPLENVSNLTTDERSILFSTELESSSNKFLFITKKGFVKIVDGKEFVAAKKTIDSTKLSEGDSLVSILLLTDEEEIILETNDGIYSRFKISEISEFKRTSIGVRGIKLKDNDFIKAAYIGNSSDEFTNTSEQTLSFQRIKLTKRDTQGTKIRL